MSQHKAQVVSAGSKGGCRSGCRSGCIVIGAFLLLVMAAGGGGDRNDARPTPTRGTRISALKVTILPTDTAEPTRTPRHTATARTVVTSDFTPQPGLRVTTEPTIYYVISNARLRSCASTSCEIVATLSGGSPVRVTAFENGESVSAGNAVWYRTSYEGREAYIYSDLVTLTAPNATVRATSTRRSASRTPVSASRTPGGATRIPSVATSTPGEATTNNQRPGNCPTAVAMGLSAEEAGQWSHLDRDGDGVACYGD